MAQATISAAERLVLDVAHPVRETIDRVGSKWSVEVLLAVSAGPVRFTELERSIEGVSRRMLTLVLRGLERDGLITRTVHPTVPPRVEYAATDIARELREPLIALATWARRHRGAICAARTAYETRCTPVAS
ncbi:helix-turn-helix domain-containing protein [Streptomyces sp. ALI-76-A]|uniref:winged helix-turn-helix transcriptional regulator n=1 Tax=Streptomyces sp. ALI-76-A TaxID=3025736 RepID=UPI00256EBA7C|nr:helix-turn-helix domain-containing protein [Streptomyces sp. ALI-76-A]MDL5198968.1 helix-turn-helix domain-containing protein [Streptomyces sp. ALI-76-A]